MMSSLDPIILEIKDFFEFDAHKIFYDRTSIPL